MELRSFCHLHFIQAIKGGSVTKVLNVTRGRPTLKFKEVAEVHDGFMFNHDGIKAERSCIDVLEERTVKTEPDSSVCNPNDDQDDQIINLDDDDFDNFTLKQIKQSCKTRKRKHSQGLESSSSKINVEDSLSLEDDTKTQMTADDSDFMETLSTWRSKLSKKTKKRKCNKDSITSSQEIIPVVKIENDQELSPSSGVSAALVEVKSEVLEPVRLDGPHDYFCIEAKEETAIPDKWYLENELNSEWKEHDDLTPLKIEWPYSTNYVTSNSELNSDQSPNILAIEFGSEEGIIHPDPNLIPPPATSLVEDHDSVIYDNQPDGDTDTPVILSNMATHKGLDSVSLGSKDDSTDPDRVILGSRDDSTDLDCMILRSRDDSAFLGECSKVEFTAGAEVQVKPSSTAEHGLSPGESQVCSSNESPEYEDKQSFASVSDDEKKQVSEASDELNFCDEHKESSKLHPPKRLLSARKAISPTSQEKLCNAMKSIDLNRKKNLIAECSGKLNYGEQTDKKNGADEGLNDIVMRPGFTDNPNKVNISPKTLKSASHPKGIFKSPHSSRSASRLGCSSVQSCSKSAIAFSKQQMHDVECLTMKLTKELKAVKDIVDDMLRSEFCLNTPLRYKVNEARMAVKNATRAEEAAKRCLSYMARDCSRFCKIMKLADGGDPPTPQDSTPRKERKKIAFADEAGGRLCQIRFYEDEEGSLLESK